MLVDDDVLPAARHLTGADAGSILEPALALAGERLVTCRPVHVQYRPASELIVRYEAHTIDGAGRSRQQHLMASTTFGGVLPGALPVTATDGDGRSLHVGVWRWPHDPVITGLATLVTPSTAEPIVGRLVGAPFTIDVVAYRPTERAVVRFVGPDRELYVKVLAAASTAALIDRLEVLGAAGVPVPEVVAFDVARGWVATAAMTGPTLREMIKGGHGRWPAASAYLELRTQLAGMTFPTAEPVRSRLGDAALHAAMLAAVVPHESARLHRLGQRFDHEHLTRSANTRRSTIHGDLHEAQLIIDDEGNISGVLDVDDVGPGDPLDDLATMLAHLTFRSVTTPSPPLRRYIGRLRAEWCNHVDARQLDIHTAAVLTGLATGPFRIQQEGWPRTTSHVLELVDDLCTRHETNLSHASPAAHTTPAQ
jgi:aminoglycoside phosphotransferase